MEAIDKSEKYMQWYEEIALPVQKIRKHGNSLVITIPKSVVDKHGLKIGTKTFPILHMRRRKLYKELKDGEVLIKLNEKDVRLFKNWRKYEEKIQRDADSL